MKYQIEIIFRIIKITKNLNLRFKNIKCQLYYISKKFEQALRF